MRPLALVAALAAAAALSVSAAATPFNVAPDQDDNFPGWVSASPYQRNAFIGFDADPATWPADAHQAGAKELQPTGTPTNYILGGTLDSSLYDSDFFTISGEYDWIASDAVTGRTGLIGINARANGLINMEWHLDNLPFHNGPKNVWLEFEIYAPGPPNNFFLGLDMVGDSPSSVPDEPVLLFDDAGSGWTLVDIGFTFETNPSWETLSLQLSTGSTEGVVLFDYLHMATECNGGPAGVIPEPATFALLGMGIGGLCGLMRRRAKSCAKDKTSSI